MALEGVEGSASCPSRSLPPGKTQCPFYRRLGGPQGWSGEVWKILPPPEFDPQTVQPVVQSLYRLRYLTPLKVYDICQIKYVFEGFVGFLCLKVPAKKFYVLSQQTKTVSVSFCVIILPHSLPKSFTKKKKEQYSCSASIVMEASSTCVQ